ncbi:penicillin-binding protein [Hugenholtzia roseola]|uniref:penicillin-binding protein n=1 Tax=Hugenholtzia roseola TaxID=1002 RepID=UPI0003F9A434|nr:penicillin-binding protein [Hugenholtzia roseola]
MRVKTDILLRVRVSFIAMFVLAILVVYKIMTIQIIEGEKWSSKARGVENRVVEATRGNIYAADGSLLATSLPFYRAALDPTISDSSVFAAGVDSLGLLLAEFYGEKTAQEYVAELRTARKENKQYKILSKKLIDYQQKKRLESFPILREGRKKGGLIVEKIEKRHLPYADLARRTVGFMSEDTSADVSGRGLEYSFNQYLAGVNGEALYELIAGDYWRPISNVSQVRPENGKDIETSLDIHLQDTVHRLLKQNLIKYQANYGTAIVMEVASGEIKAMVNLGKNNNGDYVENNNYAVGNMGSAEPGSTFKLASMMALFEEAADIISLNDSVQTGDGKHKYFEDAVMKDVSPLGKISVQEVFEKSSNVGMSLLVWKYFRKNPEKFLQHLDNFGITQPLGFQMAGEATPYFRRPNDKEWSGSTLPWMSIGYELEIAPLQTLAFYNAIANKGKLVRPQIVKRISYAGKTLQEFETQVLKEKICSDKTLQALQAMLLGVVERGTAKTIRRKLYNIAGKTGTSEKVKDGVYTEEHYTSFVGYFPAENPQYSCIVVIDEPKDDRLKYAAEIAAPIFADIADLVYFKYVHQPLEKATEQSDSLYFRLPVVRAGYRPDLELLCTQLGIAHQTQTSSFWVGTQIGEEKNPTIHWIENPLQAGLVPDVRGMRLRDAIYLLENQGLKVSFKGKGRVSKQSLTPGGRLQKGTNITLYLE